jgi:hypothetical protein
MVDGPVCRNLDNKCHIITDDLDKSTADRYSKWARRAGVVDVEKDWGEDSICNSAAALDTRLHLSMQHTRPPFPCRNGAVSWKSLARRGSSLFRIDSIHMHRKNSFQGLDTE